MIYLDNAATTRVSKQVITEITRILDEVFGNPSALYSKGIKAEQELFCARKTIAEALQCETSELYFTASGTEANNIAVLGAVDARNAWANEVVVSAFEHPSVQNTVRELKAKGFLVREVKPKNGIIDVREVASLVNAKTALVSVMRVNNETGAISDVETLAKLVKETNKRTAVHCDNIQGFLKCDFSLKDKNIDSVSISGHKVNAPKGIGALYLRKGFNIKPIMFGGGQEKGIRSGTENVAFAVGFAKAVEIFERQKSFDNATKLNGLARQSLEKLEDIKIHSPIQSSPYILNFSVVGYNSETLIHFLEQSEIYVSGGSACSKGKRSHTLTALGTLDKEIDSAIRVSFCDTTTTADVERLVEEIKKAQQSLMRKK